MNRNWVFVFIAGLFEIIWVTGLKNASQTLEWIVTFIAIGISFDLLIRSTQRLPVGTVYAVFTGIGTVGTVLVEMIAYQEPFSWMKVLFILLLISGVVGLKLVTEEGSHTKGNVV